MNRKRYLKVNIPGLKIWVVAGKHNFPEIDLWWLCPDCEQENYEEGICMDCADPAHVDRESKTLVEDYAFHCDNCEIEGARIGEGIRVIYRAAKNVWWKEINEPIPDSPNNGRYYVEAIE